MIIKLELCFTHNSSRPRARAARRTRASAARSRARSTRSARTRAPAPPPDAPPTRAPGTAGSRNLRAHHQTHIEYTQSLNENTFNLRVHVRVQCIRSDSTRT